VNFILRRVTWNKQLQLPRALSQSILFRQGLFFSHINIRPRAGFTKQSKTLEAAHVIEIVNDEVEE
jgi:hypothetical protein